jgi:hypothetical protein
MAFVVGTTLLGEVPLGRQPEAGGCFRTQAVGGISVDAAGVLKNAEIDGLNELREIRLRALQEIAGDMKQPQQLRKISLKRLEAAIAEQQKTGQPLPDSMRCLAGLQRIRYIFVYPEQNDIVLAGFGEGWKVDPRGNFVGLTTGRPVMQLDDLLTAFRSARETMETGITCSIDPTEQGLKRLREFVSTLTTIGDPEVTRDSIEQLLGPQTITLRGVPPTSHFARVLVSADYRMKRLGMNFEPAPVAGLPSYIQMIKAGPRGMQNMTPRWWLVPRYDPVLADADGLAWELRGGSVKALTEETFFGAGGAQSQPGRTNPVAQRWADNMTAKYDELSLKDPIFGELRNCMDLAIVAALVVKERLAEKAGQKLPLLLDSRQLPVDEFDAPKKTDTRASFVKKGSNWIISASGGVEIHPAEIVSKTEKTEALAPVRASAGTTSKAWWWN